MIRYIKFDELGINAIEEAPAVKVTPDGTIIGYNKESNEHQLLADGYVRYDGNEPLSNLTMQYGMIGVKQIDLSFIEPKPTRFSKLEIRRCLRKHDLEYKLDEIISGNIEFQKDWDDAQCIDLNDEMMQTAIHNGLITDDMITLIQDECEGI